MPEHGVPEMTDLTASAGRGRLADVLAARGGREGPEAPFLIVAVSRRWIEAGKPA
jgi:hypothetical protein